MFGCVFATSTGRCTKGVYGSIFSINHPDYDYVLIIDSEGLQSNEKKTDILFDRKICCFILSISDIVIINVKGEINQPMKNLLEICCVCLNELETYGNKRT